MESAAARPLVVSSRRRIAYRRSAWSVREVSVAAGAGGACRAAVLRMAGSALVWCGRGGAASLGAVAVAVPDARGGALCSTLLGASGAADEGGAAALARRLAAAQRAPVFVACDEGLDRFTLPRVERAVLAELRAASER